MPLDQPKAPLATVAKVVGVGFSFGLCLAVQIYLLGVVLGGWLDQKLGSEPWCLVGGVLLAIVFAFRQLFLGLAVWQRRSERKKD